MLFWGIVGTLLCLAILITYFSSVRVEKPNISLVMHLGKLSRIMREGWNFYIPYIQRLINESTEIHTLENITQELQTKKDIKVVPLYSLVWQIELLPETEIYEVKIKKRNGRYVTKSLTGKEMNLRRMNKFLETVKINPDGTIDYSKIDQEATEISLSLFGQVLRSFEWSVIREYKEMITRLFIAQVLKLMNEENNADELVNGDEKRLAELLKIALMPRLSLAEKQVLITLENDQSKSVSDVIVYLDQIYEQRVPTEERSMEIEIFRKIKITASMLEANTSLTEIAGVRVVRINMRDLDPAKEVLDQINATVVAEEAVKAAEQEGKALAKRAAGQANATRIIAAAEAEAIEVRGRAAAAARAADLEALTNAGVSPTGKTIVQAAAEFAKALANKGNKG
ncbi:hypothetical protein A2533_03000 [Candidatus Falkowbacteria bacterium RIFOXYD2_FULL_35_9]|nr:MAG: hypothetical protein A2533_03000 [Candidatus Falkowbacteria bacterium RIFOXYD2_FULL_35_9]